MTAVDASYDDPEGEGPLDPEAPYNAADRRAVKAKARTQKEQERDCKDVMNALLSQANGRAFLAWLMLELGGLHAPTENAAYDTNACHFREGARGVALALHALALRTNRDRYMLLLTEHLE